MAFKRKFAQTGLAVRCVREVAPHSASSDGHLGHHPFPGTTSEAPNGCVHSRMPGQRLPSLGARGCLQSLKGQPLTPRACWREGRAGMWALGLPSCQEGQEGPEAYHRGCHLFLRRLGALGVLWDCMPKCVRSVWCICVCIWGGGSFSLRQGRVSFPWFLRTNLVTRSGEDPSHRAWTHRQTPSRAGLFTEGCRH